MMGILKLAIAIGVGYSVGGSVGERVLKAISDTTDMSTHVGAIWAGRVATFGAVAYLLGKV